MPIVEKPILIVGVGRSGSTIFHRVFSAHPHVAWISARLANRYPARPDLNGRLMQAIDLPLVGRFFRRRYKPGEGYDFWDYHCKGFSTPCRDLRRDDVTRRVKKEVPRALAAALTARRQRLLLKITGWPRVAFLHEIFPDAKFINITRDGRAVINSLLNIDWWDGWRGPQNWGWGLLSPAQQAEWERFDRSFVALAGIELQLLAEAMAEARRQVPPANFLDVAYEDFCADPVGVMKDVLRFSELEWLPEFERAIKTYSIRDNNYKWQEDLTPEQQRIVDYFCRSETANGRAVPEPGYRLASETDHEDARARSF